MEQTPSLAIADQEAMQLLVNGLAVLGIGVEAPAINAMITHLDLLRTWNRAYNLTAVDDPLRAVAVHLLDSVAVSPWLIGRRVLDIGTGAGFPGLPLALVHPHIDFVLLDSRGKKIRFCDAAVRATGVGNVTTVRERVERYPANGEFDTLVARAFSSLSTLYHGARHLLAPGGRMLALKGINPEDEIEALQRTHDVRCEVVPLSVPGLNASRHLAIIEPEH
jgi:16S rRNA (guanine527-N7)-methyltransferase